MRGALADRGGMGLSARSTAAARLRRYRVVHGTAAAAIAAGVVLLLGLSVIAGFWLSVGGAVALQWAVRRTDDCQILARLGGRRLGSLAARLPVLPERSADPLRDAENIRRAGAGIVSGRAVVTSGMLDHRELGDLTSGRWDRVAVPARQVDGDLTAERLSRLPDEREVWLVRCGDEVVGGIDAARLRAAADAADRRPTAPRSRARPKATEHAI